MVSTTESHRGIINTFTCTEVDLLDPIPDMIFIEDIAHSLAYQCRFGGHVKKYYSVAQHSVLVAAMAPTELKKYALLDDACEAYLQDVTAPLKSILGEAYKLLQERFKKVIAAKFELDAELFKEVKRYDIEAGKIEQQAFQFGTFHEWQTACLSLNIPMTVYGPEQSETLFMGAFYSAFGSSYIK